MNNEPSLVEQTVQIIADSYKIKTCQFCGSILVGVFYKSCPNKDCGGYDSWAMERTCRICNDLMYKCTC